MKIRGRGGPGADGSQVHIYWRAHSSYTDRGLTLSGNKNGDTLLLREVPSDIPLSGHPDFRGREGRSSRRVRPVRRVVWGSPPSTLGPSTPAQTHRAHRVGTSPVQSQGPPGEAFFKPALSNQRSVPWQVPWKGGSTSIRLGQGRPRHRAVYSQLLLPVRMALLGERHVTVMRNENAADEGLVLARKGWRLCGLGHGPRSLLPPRAPPPAVPPGCPASCFPLQTMFQT